MKFLKEFLLTIGYYFLIPIIILNFFPISPYLTVIVLVASVVLPEEIIRRNKGRKIITKEDKKIRVLAFLVGTVVAIILWALILNNHFL